MRIAFLVVDDRFDHPHPGPFFGSAPTALLQGFSALASDQASTPIESSMLAPRLLAADFSPSIPEIHIICCVKKALPAPVKLASNIFYHQIILPSWSFLRMLHAGPVLAVRRKLREIRPDIVHAQGTERWCAISAALSPYPRVLTIHGNLRLINKITPMQPRVYWKMQEMLETFSIPRFDGIVCITNYTQRNVSDLARTTWVIPNAVDLAFFALGDERSALDPRLSTLNTPKILVVGHIQPRKNQNVFIDAMTPLADRTLFHLNFFGGAAKGDPFCDDFFAKIETRPWCSFGGMLGRQEMREEFRKASILVLPSLEDNCPMVVLEAMAAGVPVIAPNVGGVPDLIRDGENGLLIDPRSSESMRAAVERILRDSALASRLAHQAREDAEQKYHPRVIALRHMEIYGEAVPSPLLK